jgi:hypothetical protein
MSGEKRKAAGQEKKEKNAKRLSWNQQTRGLNFGYPMLEERKVLRK